MDIDEPLLLFRRQYLQCLDPASLTWPSLSLLRQPDAQQWLFRHLFDSEHVARLPPAPYQLRVLKPLLAKLEAAITDPDEDEISDALMSALSALMTAQLPPESTAVQQRSYVIFTCPPSRHAPSATGPEPSITLLESRSLISGSSNTGHRTWEAALHLACYLLSHPPTAPPIAKASILELGAGTGFLSILCTLHLGAAHVTATDGSPSVVDALTTNLSLNSLSHSARIRARVLSWGEALPGSWVGEDCAAWPYDLVLGADIIYDSSGIAALATTLRTLFALRPALVVLLSSALRNAATLATFMQTCERSGFAVLEIEYAATPAKRQKALFYNVATPMRILKITAPDSLHDQVQAR